MYTNYNEFINYLYTFQDLKYKDFHSKLILNNNLIGIRTNILKTIAKSVARTDYKSFINILKYKFYEEKTIYGLMLGYLRLNIDDLTPLLDDFIKHIDNWATCDLTASNLKIFNKNKDIGFKLINKYIKNKNYWINRFGYVLLLDYYIEDKYIDKIFKLCNNYKDEYYVKMSIAWLISMCYIKYKDKTLNYLKNNNLDNWTYNKAIQKIIESNRVDIKDKIFLKELKRK